MSTSISESTQGLYLLSCGLASKSSSAGDFFFSSRRRHTRYIGVWSSDVCSSDLYSMKWYVRAITHRLWRHDLVVWRVTSPFMGIFLSVSAYAVLKAGLLGITLEQNSQADPKMRSEERRVGKECRRGWWRDDIKKK